MSLHLRTRSRSPDRGSMSALRYVLLGLAVVVYLAAIVALGVYLGLITP